VNVLYSLSEMTWTAEQTVVSASCPLCSISYSLTHWRCSRSLCQQESRVLDSSVLLFTGSKPTFSTNFSHNNRLLVSPMLPLRIIIRNARVKYVSVDVARCAACDTSITAASHSTRFTARL